MFKIKLEQRYKISIISSIISTILSYLFLFIKLPLNPDTTGTYIFGNTDWSSISYKMSIEGGRFFKGILELFFQKLGYDTVIPFFIFILFLFSIIVFNFIVVNTFDIKNSFLVAFLSSIYFITPAYVELSLFYQDLFFHVIAICLVSLVIYNALCKNNVILPIVFAIMAVGIYQSYIFVIASIFIVFLIKQCLDKNSEDIIRKIIKLFAILIISLIGYYFLNKLSLIIFSLKTNLEGRFSLSSVGINTVIKSLLKCYAMVLILPFKNYAGMNTSLFIKIVFFITYIIIAIKIIRFLIDKDSKNKFLFVILFFLFPISMNGEAFIPSVTTIRMTQGLSSIFLFFVVLCDAYYEKDTTKINMTIEKIIIFVGICLFTHFVYYANGITYVSNIVSEATKSFTIELATQIRQTEGYNKNSKVLIHGNITNENLYDYFSYYDDKKFPIPMFQHFFLSPWEYKEAINRFAAFKYYEPTNEQIRNIEMNEDFKNMPLYPEYGSIKNIGGVIVVKFK